MTIRTNVEIDRPVKEVWDFVDNPSNLGLWLSGFKAFEPISGTPGQIGAVSRHVYEDRGRRIEMTEVITERTPLKKFSSTLTHKDVRSSISMTFTDLGSQTGLACTAVMDFTSLLFKLLSPLMKRSFQKRQDGDLNRLKAFVEKSGEM